MKFNQKTSFTLSITNCLINIYVTFCGKEYLIFPPPSRNFWSIIRFFSIFHTTFQFEEEESEFEIEREFEFKNETFNEMLNVPPPPHLHLSVPFRLFLSVFESRTFKDVWSDRWMDHEWIRCKPLLTRSFHNRSFRSLFQK